MRGLKGFVEVRMKPLFVLGCKRNRLCLFVKADQRGCSWLMLVVIVGIRWLGSQILSQKTNKKIVEIAKVLKTLPLLIHFMCSYWTYLFLGAYHICAFDCGGNNKV